MPGSMPMPASTASYGDPYASGGGGGGGAYGAGVTSSGINIAQGYVQTGENRRASFLKDKSTMDGVANFSSPFAFSQGEAAVTQHQSIPAGGRRLSGFGGGMGGPGMGGPGMGGPGYTTSYTVQNPNGGASGFAGAPPSGYAGAPPQSSFQQGPGGPQVQYQVVQQQPTTVVYETTTYTTPVGGGGGGPGMMMQSAPPGYGQQSMGPGGMGGMQSMGPGMGGPGMGGPGMGGPGMGGPGMQSGMGMGGMGGGPGGPGPRLEGWLKKRGPKSGMSWKTRYCNLNGEMVEYREAKGGSVKGTISLTRAIVRPFVSAEASSEGQVMMRKYPFGFEIDDGNRIWYFDAGSQTKLEPWLAALSDAINWSRAKQGLPPQR